MTIRRAPAPNRNFTILDNSMINDKTLSFKATGLLCYLLSKPEGWTISAERLAKCAKTDGRESVLSGLKELEKTGYLVRTKVRTANGQFVSESVIYDTPQSKPQVEPETGFPTPVNPTPENPPLLKRTEDKELNNPLTPLKGEEKNSDMDDPKPKTPIPPSPAVPQHVSSWPSSTFARDSVDCPRCHAKVGDACRTSSGKGRLSNHKERAEAALPVYEIYLSRKPSGPTARPECETCDGMGVTIRDDGLAEKCTECCN